MLLRFGLQNFRSIRTYQEVHFTASTSLKDNASRVVVRPEYPKIPILPAIAIYGANASGKSTLLKGLNFFRDAISGSYADTSGAPLRPVTFGMAQSALAEPSRFDCDFILLGHDDSESMRGIRFQYGFELLEGEVQQEWLYAFPKSHKQIWFHRDSSSETEFYFGPALKGSNKATAQLTRKNSLFLSAATASNHGQLTFVSRYFRNRFTFVLDRDTSSAASARMLSRLMGDEKPSTSILKILENADIGICQAKFEPLRMNERGSKFFSAFINLTKEHFADIDDEEFKKMQDRKELRLGHQTQEGIVFFPLNEESSGTRALLNLAAFIYVVISDGGILVVDELESSLHPLLSRKLVQIFTSTETNPKGSQIIFSTHDTNLLDTSLLRRDQVWFTEKDRNGETSIYPLTDIQTKNTDNLERGYLQGRFGAIPFLPVGLEP